MLCKKLPVAGHEVTVVRVARWDVGSDWIPFIARALKVIGGLKGDETVSFIPLTEEDGDIIEDLLQERLDEWRDRGVKRRLHREGTKDGITVSRVG